MVVIEGLFFDGKTAAAIPGRMLVADDGSVSLDPATDGVNVHIGELKIEQQLGGLPSRLRWPNGALFETTDHAALELCWQRFLHKSPSWLFRLERSRYAVALSLLTFVVFLGGTALWGIPVLSKAIVPFIPPKTEQRLGDSVLKQLDRVLFTPSTLEAEQRDQVRALFEQIARGIDDNLQPRLLFRHGGLIAANALTLPGGTIIITDEMVQLAENDAQISGVLLHELGHLTGRHTLRRMASQSGVAMLSFIMYGDVGGMSAAIISLPSVLLGQGFSRDMEREADDYAVTHMKQLGLPAVEFLTALNRLEYFYTVCHTGKSSAGFDADVTAKCMEGITPLDAREEAKRDKGLLNYASTHPITSERIARLRTTVD